MGVKKKLEDISIKVLIEMGEMKATVDFDPEELFVEETKTFRPPKKDESNPPGFYEIISARCEFMRQILYHFGELPLDLSTKIKKLIELNDYWLLYYEEKDREHILFDCDIEHILRRSLDDRRPPTINIRLIFGSKSRENKKEIPSTWIKILGG